MSFLKPRAVSQTAHHSFIHGGCNSAWVNLCDGPATRSRGSGRDVAAVSGGGSGRGYGGARPLSSSVTKRRY